MRLAAQQRERADPGGHQATDRGHDGEERLPADPGRGGDATEHDGEDRGDGSQPDPFDPRAT